MDLGERRGMGCCVWKSGLGGVVWVSGEWCVSGRDGPCPYRPMSLGNGPFTDAGKPSYRGSTCTQRRPAGHEGADMHCQMSNPRSECASDSRDMRQGTAACQLPRG